MIKVPQDSYISVADADAYHALRQSAEVWTAMDDTAKERALVTASDFLDVNYRLKDGLNAAMRAGRAEVLPEVQKAVCELAMQQQLTANEKPKQRSVKVGEIAVTYAVGDEAKAERFAYVVSLLGGLLEKKRAVGMVPVVRG
ncbi:DnaT-like ssDNA-binding protein [Neisseria shayeganii]|uniref:Putative bacteriophage protein n=1 Tax=Neisseria shayeganii 871 TaxID=1032488 RepID=G4CG94_9NEIS|nr:DnaT-like ssDNA-binding protein [Neisseria shayeganii]EGY53142.1 putative bacteriophage protein [Neisseria shayeganii 871]